MEFKEFFSMMKKRISDGYEVPAFFRELIAMITKVTEDEWNTPKDPATKKTKDSTLRAYAKDRGPSQKFAQSIVYRLDKTIFVESLKTRPKTVLEILADDFKPYDATANSDNIASKLADVFMGIIRKAAGLVEPTELERQRQSQNELDLRNRYGEFLLNEAGYACPFPGCGRSLVLSSSERTFNSYNVVTIDKTKESTLKNLLAVCPNCYATYSLDEGTRKRKELINVKKLLMEHQRSVQSLDSISLEKGIVGVLSQIKKLKLKDIEDSSLDPKELTQKINPDENLHLFNSIKNDVTVYYPTIHKIMINADKRGVIDYGEVQHQIGAMYKKLSKSKKPKEELFNELVEKIHKVSLYDTIYCQIVVSYFVQNCEVFDAITK